MIRKKQMQIKRVWIKYVVYLNYKHVVRVYKEWIIILFEAKLKLVSHDLQCKL